MKVPDLLRSRVVCGLLAVTLSAMTLSGCNGGGWNSQKPTVANQSAGQTQAQTVMAGQSATFRVTATGPGPFTYQWYRNGALIPSAVSSFYTLPATTSSDNGASFTVAVTNANGTTTSTPFVLTVNAPPTFTLQPASQTVMAGQPATFTVTAAGTGPFTYQWDQNGEPIPGATSNSYSIPATAVSGSGSMYTVAVSNANGMTMSTAATLTVTPPPPPPPSLQWVVAWGASPENALSTGENPGGNEQSFRFLLLPTIDGTQERVHFSNRFGLSAVTIGAARLAVSTGRASIDPARDTALTFSGASSITLAAGQEIVSDPVNITYAFGEKLAVSVYVKGAFPPLTQHESQVTTNYASVAQAGDTTTDAAGSSFPTAMTEWYLLTGVDTYGQYEGTVALFGSSSVDGHESNYGDANSYPVPNVPIPSQDNDRPSDWLARQLVSAGYRMGVLNAGTVGDPAGEDSVSAGGAVLAGVDRMKHDVLQQAGVKAVVIYFGGIDLRVVCAPATNVEASLINMVSQAQAAGVRVILATLPPAEYCMTSSADLLPSAANPYQGDLYPGPENPGSTQRRAVNDWIRTTGAQLPGVVAIADFDKTLAYPAHPDFLMPNYYSGDNFHPNGVGYGVQSSAIPLSSLLAPQ